MFFYSALTSPVNIQRTDLKSFLQVKQAFELFSPVAFDLSHSNRCAATNSLRR